jgi:hypothetical protein
MEEEELQEALAARQHSTESSGNIGFTLNNITIPSVSSQFNLYPFHSAPAQLESLPQDNPMQSWPFPDPIELDMSLNTAPVGQMPWSLLSSSEDLSIWDNSLDPVPMSTRNPSPIHGSTPKLDARLRFDLSASLGFTVDDLTLPMTFPAIAPSAMTTAPVMMPEPVPPAATDTINEVINAATTFGQIQLDEREISQSARDYLYVQPRILADPSLDLFFAPPREPFGCEAFTEAQFRQRLSLQPHRQPHPCFLFAMYTMAASSSFIPAVRALSDSLYAIAAARLEESIHGEDRLLDAIRASKMLSKWLYSKFRPLEGYQMGWKTMS